MPILLHALAESITLEYVPNTKASKIKVFGDYVPGTAPKKFRCTITNDPWDKETFDHFDAVVKLLNADQVGLQDEKAPHPTVKSPIFNTEKLGDIGGVKEFRDAGVTLVDENGKPFQDKKGNVTGTTLFRLATRSAGFAFVLNSPEAKKRIHDYNHTRRFYKSGADFAEGKPACSTDHVLGLVNQLAADATPLTPAARKHYKDAVARAEINLRSTQNVIYYLGELARVKGEPRRTIAALDDDGQPMMLFRMIEDFSGIPAAISVAYEEQIHKIPSKDAGRSMQMLALVRQLFALNLSAEAPRGTQVVRFLN